MKPELNLLLDEGHGIVTRAAHPHLEHQLDSAVKTGALVPLFTGVYTRPDLVTDFGVRALALMHADPGAVLTGESARHLIHQTRVAPAIVTAATTRLRSREGYDFERRNLPDSLIETWRGLRMTSPALTAVDLALPLGATLDEALRTRVPLQDLR